MNEEQLIYLQDMIGALANGINPVSGEILHETVFDEPQVIRGLFGIKEILGELISGGGSPKEKARPKGKFVWRDDLDAERVVQPEPICLTPFLYKIKQINDGIAPSAKQIWNRLLETGILREVETASGTKLKLPTEKAGSYGISCQDRYSESRGIYKVVVYDGNGQKFLLDVIKDLYGA